MVKAIVSASVSNAMKMLSWLENEKAKLVYWLRKNIEQMQVELRMLHRWLQMFDEIRLDEYMELQYTMFEIKNAAQDAEDVIESCVIKVAFCKNPLYRFIYLVKAVSKSISICSKLHNLPTLLEVYAILSRYAQRSRQPSRYPILEEFTVGLDDDINKVVGWLLMSQNHDSNRVYICGMGGLGKTTLAKEVYHHNAIRCHFDAFAWTNLSQKSKRADVWQSILSQLTSHSEEEEKEIINMGSYQETQLAQKLYKLQKERKCLIVFDDICSEETWYILGPAFPSPTHTRSKIVFTSCNTSLLLNSKYRGLLHEPKCLDEEESWALFEMKAFPRKDCPGFTICNDFKRLGEEMIKKCVGLPLAIIELGELMVGKDSIDEREIMHKRIVSNRTRGEVFVKNSRLKELLDSSYHDLPEKLKPCFLYLSLFPEGYEIPRNKLVQLWAAEGFISTCELEASDCLDDLLSRCMVQVGERSYKREIKTYKTYRLHNVMRDMCLSKATKEYFLRVIGGLQQKSGNDGGASSSNASDEIKIYGVRKLVVFLDQHANQLIPQDCEKVGSCIRSLIYFHKENCVMKDWRIAKQVFENFKLLRVLDFEGINAQTGHSLPKEVGNLLWLEFLSMKGTGIRKLSTSLGNLEYLITLNLPTVDDVSCNTLALNMLFSLVRN